jgi:glycyl-tRNA synthetase
LGTPYGCTIDFACKYSISYDLGSTLNLSLSCLAVANGTLTLRERDSTDQLIGKIDDVIAVTVALSNSQMKWSEACEKLEKYSGTQEIE